MSEVNSQIARRIVDTVGSNGIPPEYGFQYFTAGLSRYLDVIDEEYLSTFIKDNGSSFKLVVGEYGGGKTHFLYCVREMAWKQGFVVSYVSLSPTESPFHKLELVYGAIARSLTPPLDADELLSGYEKGIDALIRRWYADEYRKFKESGMSTTEIKDELLSSVEQIQGLDSKSYMKAVKEAFRALVEKQEEKFDTISQWLTGEGYDRKAHGQYGILQRIDKTTAFIMIRSLVQWIKQIGFSGLIVLLDEAEQVPSLSGKQKEQHLINLREMIDQSSQAAFQGVMIFYAVPNESFLEGRQQVYEALRQRVSPVFDMNGTINPTGVKIELEKLVTEPIPFLEEIGGKLADLYQKAYSVELAPADTTELVSKVAEDSYEQRYMDIGYKRLFVQSVIKGLNYLKQTGEVPSVEKLR